MLFISVGVYLCDQMYAYVPRYVNTGILSFMLRATATVCLCTGLHVSSHMQMLPLKNVFICFETAYLPVSSVFEFVCARRSTRAVCQL